MSSLKNALCLLAVVAAYGLAAYWDTSEDQERERQSDPSARTASDDSRARINVPTTKGVQHAHR